MQTSSFGATLGIHGVDSPVCDGVEKTLSGFIARGSAQIFQLLARMGVNGQKRKKKQGPVPSLEETLPKKFKSEKIAKSKNAGTSVKRAVGSKKVGEKGTKKAISVEVVNDKLEDGEFFGAARASLFDDDEVEETFDEFEGLDGAVDMYPP